MSYSEVERLNQTLPVPLAADELDLFLRFQHETASIMYFMYVFSLTIISLYETIITKLEIYKIFMCGNKVLLPRKLLEKVDLNSTLMKKHSINYKGY